jgi:ribosomal protein S18 acetylase RimI-like enzyme
LVRNGIRLPKHMNERQLKEIRELAGICNAADGIELKLNWSMLEKRPEGEPQDFLWYENGRLAGFLALYRFNPSEAEIGGMVHPDYRRNGIFSTLMEKAIQSAANQGIPKLLFVCPHQSAAAQEFLKSKQTEYAFSEFGMKLADLPDLGGYSDKSDIKMDEDPADTASPLRLVKAGPEDRELLIRLDSQGFEMPEADGIALVDMILNNPNQDWPYIAYKSGSIPVGRINIHVRDGNAHFFGFSVLPEHRRQGCGRLILTGAIRMMAALGLRSMTLEVSCENRKALELYQHCGFRETYVNDYYSLPVDGAKQE